MKTNLQKLTNKGALAIIACLATFTIAAQPSYNFTTNSLVSGTDKQKGAEYRFSTVKSGVDALVTIDTLTGGMTLDSLDVASLGFNAAFQPQIRIGPWANGYIEFNIQFVVAGTLIPVAQVNMPVTGIDIDGHIAPGDTVAEYDEVNLGLTGVVTDVPTTSQISLTTSGSWVTAKNIGGVEYTGVDTLGKDVMFTVVNALTTSFKVRTGVDNRSANTVSRNSSLFFQKFTYPFSVLAISPVTSFAGTSNGNSVRLEWSIASESKLQSVTLEKSDNGSDYLPVNEYWLNIDSIKDASDFQYTDNSVQAIVYYRLKMTSDDGTFEYSNILNFRTGLSEINKFKVYPTLISSSATISFSADVASRALLQLVDYSGRVVYHQTMQLSGGNNDFSVSSFGNLPAGNYVAVLRTSDKIYNQKVIMK
jgi:hypothetical protein